MAKKITRARSTSPSPSMKKKKKQRLAAAGIVGAVAVCLIGVLIFFAIQPTPTDELTTTITLISGADGEDVSWVNTEIYNITAAATIDEWADIQTSTNWELATEGPANELSIDVADYPYGFWIRINDDTGYFADEWFYQAPSEEQLGITVWVLHRPSDVIFANLDAATYESSTPGANTTGTYRMVTRFPGDSALQLHVGNDFTATIADYNLDQAYYRNQANWRMLRPSYDLTDNTYAFPSTDTSTPINSMFTETFAFAFTANATIVEEDADPAQINVTVSAAYALYWRVAIDDDTIYIYCVSTLMSDFTLEYTMSLGEEIEISTIEAGLVSVPALVIDSFTAF